MTLSIISEPSAAVDQIDNYNGPRMVVSASYSPSQGTDWAVIGLVLADAVTVGDEDALVSSLEGLSGISQVANPRFWGQCPDSIEAGEAYEQILHSSISASCTAGTVNNQWDEIHRKHASIQPPLSKKWMVINCTLPSPLTNQTSVNSLQSSCEGITGITTAKVLSFGSIPNPANGISMRVETRLRMDPVEA